MIVRDMRDIPGTEREVVTEHWTSCRILLKKDGMGFSMHETVIRSGAELTMHYKNHLEAVYITTGEGTLHNLEDGRLHRLAPGVLYALNGHERHIVKAQTDMRMVCVFSPPVSGTETHDADGAYPLEEETA